MIYELTLVQIEIKNTYFPDYKFALIFFFEKAVQSLVFLDKNCDKPCPENCQERRCGIISGKCLGCLPGWIGEECKEGSSIN